MIERAKSPDRNLHEQARSMWMSDRLRYMRALVVVLEAVLPADADPRSRAVIPMLQAPDRYRWEDWVSAEEQAEAAMSPEAAPATRAEWAAEAAWWAAITQFRYTRPTASVRPRIRLIGCAPAAAETIACVVKARPDLEIMDILLRSWEQG